MFTSRNRKNKKKAHSLEQGIVRCDGAEYKREGMSIVLAVDMYIVRVSTCTHIVLAVDIYIVRVSTFTRMWRLSAACPYKYSACRLCESVM